MKASQHEERVLIQMQEDFCLAVPLSRAFSTREQGANLGKVLARVRT